MSEKILPQHERYLNRAKAAEIFDVKPSCLEKWNRLGIGPKPVKFGRRCVRYKLSDLLVFAESRARVS